MNGTFAGDLHELRVLLLTQRAGQFHFNVNPVQHAFLRFAFLTILRVNVRVRQRNSDVLERHLFPARI